MTSRLIEALRPAFLEGRMMLLRVGRHSGAESVTLDRLRWIRIRGGRHRQDYWAREATTLWLAAEHEDSASELRPLGWLLVERPTARRESISNAGANAKRKPLLCQPSRSQIRL